MQIDLYNIDKLLLKKKTIKYNSYSQAFTI